jgi:hypothetical protein
MLNLRKGTDHHLVPAAMTIAIPPAKPKFPPAISALHSYGFPALQSIP